MDYTANDITLAKELLRDGFHYLVRDREICSGYRTDIFAYKKYPKMCNHYGYAQQNSMEGQPVISFLPISFEKGIVKIADIIPKVVQHAHVTKEQEFSQRLEALIREADSNNVSIFAYNNKIAFFNRETSHTTIIDI